MTSSGSPSHNTQKVRLFKQPPVTDWCIWLGIVAVIAGISGTASSHGFLLDYVFAIAFQWALFAVLPASIRRSVQRGKSTTTQ
jgi:hypothetical protein